MQGLLFKVYDSGSTVSGFGVQGLRYKVFGSIKFRVRGSGSVKGCL